MWAPWLGASKLGAPGSSMWRTSSANTPVALTTARAEIEHSSPVSSSRASAPLMLPFVLEQSGHGKVIERAAFEINQGARQRDGQPSVVELAIGVDDPAAQACAANRGDASDDLGPRDPARAAQVETARQPIVEPETGRVVRQLPVMKRGHHELSRVDQVRGVLEQQRTLVKCLANEWDIALCQISDSAMNELGAAAGGSVSEVARFEEQGAVAAGGGIDGCAQSRCAAANDKDVPRLTRAQPIQVFRAR